MKYPVREGRHEELLSVKEQVCIRENRLNSLQLQVNKNYLCIIPRLWDLYFDTRIPKSIMHVHTHGDDKVQLPAEAPY